jgi:CheY-specific phosphatase CheX
MNDEWLSEAVTKATVLLFRDYDIALTPMTLPSSEHPVELCGGIGFSGKHARGTLLCAATKEPLRLLAQGKCASERDWLAEISNQLLGRIKSRLLRRGIEIMLSPPIVLRGEHLAPLPRATLLPLSFSLEGGAVFVWLDVEIDPSVKLADAEEHDVGLVEGQSLIF